MKMYVQFLMLHNSTIQECCGSDGVYILDARNSRQGHIAAIQLRMHQLRNVRTIVGYRVYRGSRFDVNNEMIVEWIRSGVNYTSGSLYKQSTFNWRNK